MLSSESPEYGLSFPHDPAYLTPSSSQIATCNTQNPTTPPDEPPLLKGGATGPGLSSPDATTTSSNSSLEEFLMLLVLQNNNNISINLAILADNRLWKANKDFYVQTYPQLYLLHSSTGTDTLYSSSVDKDLSGKQLESLKQEVERLEEQSMKQSQITFILSAREDFFTALYSYFLSL
ncbi:uncharacterized protein CIMG_08232 [Coccidioides immitis RS]|uniref:Uncharacterized protein n=1 Tax=Coccidioides immitis (strain RS) TaxID=246410 RepID=J3K528_COCIM|nr:uncharacterized protein CIMG_08232 [Coccidioides immitis RS]EAS29486.3 hypothetical protein CIMG_08232 [Coccidioides immitis RS]